MSEFMFIYKLLYTLLALCIITMVFACFLVLFKCKGKIEKIGYDKLLLAIGVILSCKALTYYSLLIFWIYYEKNPLPDTIIPDWHPFPDMVSFALNLIIPIVVVVLSLIIFFDKNALKQKAGLIGVIL